MEHKRKKHNFKINGTQSLHEILENAAPLLDRRIFLAIATISMLTSALLISFCVSKSGNIFFLTVSLFLSILLYILSYYSYKKSLYILSYIFPILLNTVLFMNLVFFLVGTKNLYTYIIILYVILSSALLIYHIYKLKTGISSLREFLVADAQKKNNFYANVNHDLRTPLHIILGMNEMIMRESIAPNVTEYAINSHKAGEHLMTLINKLMIYSKLGQEKISPINVQFSLPILIDTYIIGYKKLCSQKGISFNINVSSNIPHDLIGDNILFRQIIYNLTTNLSLLPECKSIKSNFYWDSITDTQGILHFDISIPNVISDDSDLDLKTVTDIVDIMNGTVKITKNDASGTQIKVYMPFDSSSTKLEAINNSFQYSPSDSDFIAPNAKILIVDDTEMNIKVFSLLLKRTLIKIDSALTGADALKLIAKKKYDLIFVDYMMPEMNGAELFEAIKERHPNLLETTPIYVISANTSADTREKLINLGFSGFLPKPIESSTLDFIIRHNLPQELISSPSEISNKNKHNTNYDEFAADLNNFDIDLNEGLKYMNDDIIQYASVAELIVKNYQKTLDNIVNLHEQRNIKDLGITVHALKGNAKYIGATTLYNISQSLEIKATMNEFEFISHALPLLYYEWDKIIKGLTLFLEKYNNSKYAATVISSVDNINTDSYLEQLIDYVDELHPEPAIKLIKQVIKQKIAPDYENKLKQVTDYLEEFEYDEAMNILKEINQCSKNPD